MDAAHGVGLAANQIGTAFGCSSTTVPRIAEYPTPPRCDHQSDPGNLRDTRDHARPGRRRRRVLSVPGESFPTGRAKWARVTGIDADGNPITIEGTGLFARMLQHETGHLDGFLYLDRLIGRHARAAKRAVKSQGWGVRADVDAGRGAGPVRSLMVSWPDLGTRVTVRYRRPAGSVPPLTDAVGHLLAVDPVVRVRPRRAQWSSSRPPTWSRCDAGRRTGAHLGDPGTRARGRRGLAQR